MAANDEHIAWSTESAMWKLALRDGVATKIAAARGYGLALDGTHVYFRRDGQIFRLSLVSGESETLAEDDMVGSDLAVDDRFVYWANKLVPPSVKRLAK
jgi:hypothetical protein